MSTKKMIIYPGTFNPISNAHIEVAKKASSYIDADTFAFLPTGMNDMKEGFLDPICRIEMIKKCLPLLNNGKTVYSINAHEVDKGEELFWRRLMLGDKGEGEEGTYHSLKEIKKQYEDCEIYILMGDDNAVEVDTWIESEKLMSTYKFLVFPRDFKERELKEKLTPIWKKNVCNIMILPYKQMQVSSTNIRESIKYKNYEQAKQLVPETIFNHFIVNDYYDSFEDRQSIIQDVYKTLDKYLKAFEESANLNIEKLIDKMKQKLKDTGCEGYVLGMSGGVDCSLMAALCHRGNIPIKLVSMPSNKSMDEDPMKHALAVADIFNKGELDVHNIYLEINNINISANESCNMKEVKDDMAYANIAPRIRMTMLYTIAQRMNYLVLGTSNLSEITMGYFTKWGDGAADIEPIASYTKSEVRVLAKTLFSPYKRKELDEIINKPPSAELWKGQTDEEEMGITYKQIDTYLKIWSEYASNTGIDIDKKIADKIRNIEYKNMHKRISLIK